LVQLVQFIVIIVIPTPTAKPSNTLPGSYYPGKPTPTSKPSTGGTVPTEDTKVTVDVPGVDTTNVTNSKDYENAYDDRSNIINIRYPQPLPEEWCKMNHISVDDIRKLEKEAKQVVDQFNHIPGYISNSALVNHADVLSNLAQKGVKFHGYVGDKKVNINYNATNPAAVDNIRTKVVAVANQVYQQVKFAYPQVVQNIFNAVDVFNNGRLRRRI
ncbi:hypothetical protein SYNPS1DRAFT_22556, partial [Syncephalis pseudoplumigaleata]